MTLEVNGIPCRILGTGGSGVVVMRDYTAIKLPRPYLSGRNDDDDEEVIRRENDVYLRLGKCDGVVPYLDLSGPGIDMV